MSEELLCATPALCRHGVRVSPPKTLTLYPDYEYTGYKWGMAIDLGASTISGTLTVTAV